jgi:tetratricopeptide (TPR) repeat protein
MKAWRLAGALVLLAGCHRPAPEQPSGATTPPPSAVAPTRASSAAEKARALLDAGQADQALALLPEGSSDPDVLALRGLAWAKKAELAPLPTPPPVTAGAKGPAPQAPEFKPEELQALESFERALTASAGHPLASLGLADLLAPHSLRRYAAAPSAKPGTRRGKPGAADGGAPEVGPDFRPERVIQAYRAAIQGDPSAKGAVERLLDFATRVGRVDDVDQALQELLRRDKEKPEPLVRYGDFLLNQRKDPIAAIEQYRQALIWKPDDNATRAKIADIYIAQGIDLYGKNQYAVAEARLLDAQKYVSDPRSPQGLKIQDYMGKLKAIRAPSSK